MKREIKDNLYHIFLNNIMNAKPTIKLKCYILMPI